MDLGELQMQLIESWQHGFPLVARPFAHIAAALGTSEGDVIAMLSDMSRRGILSRVGVTVRPNTVGASTLAAMSVPPARLEEVAAIVNHEAGVNHNYEREHAFNLWFVVTGRDRGSVSKSLNRIQALTGLSVLVLPLERSYCIDLGFSVNGQSGRVSASPRVHGAEGNHVTENDRDLLIGLEEGLPLTAQPYQTIGKLTGLSEAKVIEQLSSLIARRIISRFGLIIRHRELGFRANAMTVWDIDDENTDRVGELLAAQPFVTLCYRRPRRLPDWPYNLFCMIHGRERPAVIKQIKSLNKIARIEERPSAILFSRRRFKQRGAKLSAA